MRTGKPQLLSAALLALAVAPSGAVANSMYRSHVSGVVAVTSFSSDDGCVATSGMLAAVHTRGSGGDGDFAIVVAESWDSCAPDGPAGRFYAGGGAVSYSASGLSSASASGTLEVTEYTGHGHPPLTVEFDLDWAGTGPVDSSASHFASGGGGATISVTSSRTRAAGVSGAITVDGFDASAGGGWLGAESSGELSIVARP